MRSQIPGRSLGFFMHSGTTGHLPVMTRIKLLLIALSIPYFSFSQLDSLKGPVRSVQDTITYLDSAKGFTLYLRGSDFGQYSLTGETVLNEFKKKTLFPGWVRNNTKEYDRKGHLLKTTQFYPHYKMVSIEERSYDEYGNLVKQVSRSADRDEESRSTSEYTYIQLADSAEHVVAELNYGSDPGHFSMKQYFYNRKSQLLEERDLSGFGWNDKISYQYDERGRLIAEIRFRLKRNLGLDIQTGAEIITDSAEEYHRINWKYAEDGQLLEKISGCKPYLVKNACTRIKYLYDCDQRISAIYYYWTHMDTIFSHREYEYNTDNTIKKIAWVFKDEKLPGNYVKYYYSDKELSKAIFTDNGKVTVIEFKYKLDTHNNWTEQQKIVNNELIYVRKREIAYWD